MSLSKITLNCLFFGDEEPFSVETSTSTAFINLKESIQAKVPYTLKGINPHRLRLFKKVMLSKERGSLLESELKTEDLLDPLDEVGEHFDAATSAKHIHIVIKVSSK